MKTVLVITLQDYLISLQVVVLRLSLLYFAWCQDLLKSHSELTVHQSVEHITEHLSTVTHPLFVSKLNVTTNILCFLMCAWIHMLLFAYKLWNFLYDLIFFFNFLNAEGFCYQSGGPDWLTKSVVKFVEDLVLQSITLHLCQGLQKKTHSSGKVEKKVLSIAEVTALPISDCIKGYRRQHEKLTGSTG